MKKTLVAITLAVLFTLALAVPAFAQFMSYSGDYVMNGTISGKLHAGHLCNTGAEMKQTISGAGSMTKTTDIYMVEGKIDVEDNNQFVAAATSSLAVITAIELCAPPKWLDDDGDPVTVGGGYHVGWDFPDDYEALTKQIWAAHVKADPGFSGQLDMAFTAAYGPLGDENDPKDDEWYYDHAEDKYVRGVDYVGNYFNITQFMRTSMGATQRFISLSSPWSHAYLTEDMTIVGMSEISETFKMMNLKEGEAATTDWWDLF